MNFVANIPYTKCWVRKEYLHDLKRGHGELVEAIMFAVKSVQGRALMFEAYLPEYGACFDKFPLSAFVWKENIKEEDQLPLGTIELWDSFSSNIQVWTKSLLKASDVEIMLKGGGRMKGEYMFTIDWCHPESNILDTEHSEIPHEHKCGHVMALDNGNYSIQPNNRILWNISNFTTRDDIPDYKVQTTEWNVENKGWITEDTDKMFYKIEDK